MTLTSFCAGLVIIDEEGKLLSLLHPTAREYFSTKRPKLLAASHEEIAMTCITYLRMRSFNEEGIAPDLRSFSRRVSTSHLLGYAAGFWGQHALKASSERVYCASLALLSNEKTRLAASQALLLNIAGTRDWGTEWPEYIESKPNLIDDEGFISSLQEIPDIHLASFFGLEQTVRTLLASGSKVNELDGMGGTALHRAILGEQDSMLSFLLNAGADPNIHRKQMMLRRWQMIGCFTLPLTMAAYRDNVATVKLLLHHGAEVDKYQKEVGPIEDPQTALSTALYAWNDSTTTFLLDSGADPNLAVSGIYWASVHSKVDIIQQLVEKGLTQENLDKALVASASAGQVNNVELLLKAGANAEPSRICVEGTKSEEAKSLLEEADWPPPTALVSSIERDWTTDESDHFKCSCLLIEAGASVNHICYHAHFYSNNYIPPDHNVATPESPLGPITTPILTAAFFGDVDIVHLLAENKADLNFVPSKPVLPHPLKAALDSEKYFDRERYSHVVKEEPDVIKRSPSLRVRDTVESLIKLGANPNLCSKKDQQRIHHLLGMSDADCEVLAAFQNIIGLTNRYGDRHQFSFRERKQQLIKLIEGGADPALCCQKDREEIENFQKWTESDVDRLDVERLNDIASHDRWNKGPLMV